MTKLFRDPFYDMDLMFRNLLNHDSHLIPLANAKIGAPVDAWEEDDKLRLDAVIIGANKEDIKVFIPEGSKNLRIIYEKPESKYENRKYICENISRKNINLDLYISDHFDISKTSVKYENNILSITIPKDVSHPKELKFVIN